MGAVETFELDDRSAERVAKNEATFREANERILTAAETHEIDEGIPFICECADVACTEVLRLSTREYEEIRSDPTHFLNAPGHHRSGGSHVRVVSERDGYEIVEKVGHAGEVAEQLDDREEPA